MINKKQKIFKAIENNRLKLIGWKKNWYNYIINIQELFRKRNNINWYFIDVFDLDENFLQRIKLEIKPIFKY